MRTVHYKCNCCGEDHPAHSDLIFGYRMRKMNLCNKLEYVPKDKTDRHICLDCINVIRSIEGMPPKESL